jgi:predicted GNAT family N-acyltransferase
MNQKFSILELDWAGGQERLLAVRTAVFVIEQQVPAEIEVDEYDPISEHVLAIDAEGNPIGTARLLPEGKIGRVAVLKDWRQHGVGSLLMKTLIKRAQTRGDREIQLHAQCWTIPFYETLGFRPEGDEFLEAGISHRKMRLKFCHT